LSAGRRQENAGLDWLIFTKLDILLMPIFLYAMAISQMYI